MLFSSGGPTGSGGGRAGVFFRRFNEGFQVFKGFHGLFFKEGDATRSRSPEGPLAL